jgi:hypothetical protein
MTDVKDFLGGIVADVVRRLIAKGHPGIRLLNVTAFDPGAMLKHLPAPQPRVAVAGGNVAALAKATKYPPKLLTAELADATDWRNDPAVTDPVVIVSFSEEERLGSFHRFTEVRDRDLYQAICDAARKELCPNTVQETWWDVLSRTEVSRLISVYRLAAYFLYLNGRAKHIPEASRDGLYLLGLLPSKEFFDHRSTPVQLLRNLRNNRQLTNRIEILNNADRDRLTRAVDAAAAAERSALQTTLGKILKYNRTGKDEDRAELTAEEVRGIFEAKKGKEGAKGTQKVIPIERAGVDALLEGDEQELAQLGKSLRETIQGFEENETPTVTLELTHRTEQAGAKIPPPLIRLLARAISGDVFGGKFRFPNAESFDVALGDIDNAEFTGFTLDGEKTFQTLLQRVINSKIIEPEVLDIWKGFVKARGILAEQAAAIAISPMVALASDKKLLKAGRDYLEAYSHLTAAIRDRYEAVASQSSTGARHLCAQLLILDTILLETTGNIYAILTPLHPLHLWKYVRLADQLRDDKSSLGDEQKRVLAETAERLPHFVTALFVPEGLVSDRARILPESHQIATLPCYQQDNPHYAGVEGQERLLRILRKFLVLYPHAKRGFRLCVVDPPDLPGFLEQLASRIANEEFPVDGMHLTVRRTLDRTLSLGTDEQQLETIAGVFGAEDSPRFVLNIQQARTTYPDILTQLKQDPVHVLAVFDPSRSQVGRFSRREPGFVHPLVLPKEFQYDPIEDQLVITPAATGDLFDVYYSLQNRLNDSLTGSHFGVSTTLGPGFPKTGELLKHCTWLVLGDKLADSLPTAGGHMISFEPGNRRDIIVLTESLTKFEREFDYHLRKANLDPTEESLRELISASAELVGEGLLGLIRPDGDE